MTDWDRYRPEVMGAYNPTQHSSTRVSPHLKLTRDEMSLPLTFFYPEYEGKKTSPQVYVRVVIRRQQELNDLLRRNTQQVQAGHRKRVACEVNEKGTREKKNDGNEIAEEGSSPPLDLDPNEVIEADEETLPYAEEDWQDPEQMEFPKNLEPDLPFTIQTRHSDKTRLTKKYNA